MTDNPLLDFGEEESSVYHMVDADRIMNPDEGAAYRRIQRVRPRIRYRCSVCGSAGMAAVFRNSTATAGQKKADFLRYHGYGDFDDSPYDLSVSDEFTLEESLLNQVDLSEEPYLVRATAAYIVQTLDENGYMTFSVPETRSS